MKANRTKIILSSAAFFSSALAFAFLFISTRKLSNPKPTALEQNHGWTSQDSRDRFYDEARRQGTESFYEDGAYPEQDLWIDPSPTQLPVVTDLEGYYPEHSSLVNPWFTDNGLKGKLTEALTMLPAIKQHVLVGRDHGISASKSLRRFTNLLAARRSGTLRTAAMMSSIPAIQLAEEDGGEEGADAPAIPADYVWRAGFKWMGDGYDTTPGTAQAATRSSRRRRSPGGHALHSRAALNPRSLAGVRRPASRCCPAAPSPCASPPSVCACACARATGAHARAPVLHRREAARAGVAPAL